MILIGSNIIDTLKASLNNVTIRESYTGLPPVYPMITIDEIPSNDGGYAGNQPRIVRNIFTLEVYAKNMMMNGKPMSKKSAAMLLIMQADKILNEVYGLTMTGNVHGAPYDDETVFRVVARYNVYIDTQTKVLYRGLIK